MNAPRPKLTLIKGEKNYRVLIDGVDLTPFIRDFSVNVENSMPDFQASYYSTGMTPRMMGIQRTVVKLELADIEIIHTGATEEVRSISFGANRKLDLS